MVVGSSTMDHSEAPRGPLQGTTSVKPIIFSVKKDKEEREKKKKQKPLYIIKKRFFNKKKKVKEDVEDPDSPEQIETLLEKQSLQISNTAESVREEEKSTSISQIIGHNDASESLSKSVEVEMSKTPHTTGKTVEEIELKSLIHAPATIQQLNSPPQLQVKDIPPTPDTALPVQVKVVTRPVVGKPIPIYIGKEPLMHNLSAVLERSDVRDLPIYVLALAGEYRTGKSFLLSYMLRKLFNQDVDEWLGDPDEPLGGFDHKYDDKSVTKGINIWSEPLIIEKNNEKVVVLLMDCQGIFSAKEEEESTRIFALSTMVSSVLVFNLMHQLSESVLNYLQLFTAYAKMAGMAETNRTPFQKLFLLIRDWGKKDIKPFGSEGGKLLFNEYFQGRRDFLRDTFNDLDSYLMPRPGDIVEEKDYDGSLRKLRPDFKQHLKSLTELLMDPIHLRLNIKEVTGQKVTAKDFCRYFEECTKLLENVDWKQPQNLMEMHTTFNCELAKRGAIKTYKSNMEKIINSGSTLMTEAELNHANEIATEEARKKFDDISCFTQKNNKEMAMNTKNILEKDYLTEFNIYKSEWQTQLEIEKLKHDLDSSKSMYASIKANYGKIRKYGGAGAIGSGLGATVGAVGEVAAASALSVSAASGIGAAVGASLVVVGAVSNYAYKKYKRKNVHRIMT